MRDSVIARADAASWRQDCSSGRVAGGADMSLRMVPVAEAAPRAVSRVVHRKRPARVVYFIASHVNPDQVARLVRACRSGSPEARVLLHHDYNVSHLDPAALGPMDNIDLLTGGPPVGWGAFSMCEMVLRNMRWLLDRRDFDWVYYLSGQDYPIRPLRQIESFLSETSYDGFVAARPVEEHAWRVGPMRYLYQYRSLPTFPGSARLKDMVNRRAHASVAAGRYPRVHVSPEGGFRIGYRPPNSPFRDGFRCYKGSNWWTLSRRAVEYLVRFARNNPALCRYYRNIQFAAGESLYTTILLNNPRLKVQADDNQRFIRWSRPDTGHPDLLCAADVPAMTSSGRHFARKLDQRKDSQVLDLLDEHIGVARR